MRDRRGRRPDWVQLYFEFKVLNAITRVLGAIGAGFVLLGWLVVYAIAPDYGTDYFVWCFVFAVAAIVVCVFLQIYLWCRKPKPQPEWVPHGAIANPPGENWFDDNGNKLWVRVGDRWERVVPERHP